MSVSDQGIWFFLLLVFPGFLSYRAALARSPDPSRRSTLWQLAEIAEYSIYIHLLGIALLFLASVALDFFGGLSLHSVEIVTLGPANFLTSYPIEGVITSICYTTYVVIAAVLMGLYKAPHAVASGLSNGFDFSVRGLRHLPLLSRIPSPSQSFPDEPVWYKAFHEAAQASSHVRPELYLRMKSGDIYYGELASYALLPDDQIEKDFLIRKALYVSATAPRPIVNLENQAGGGTVLLNTSNVESIQVYYVPFAQDSSPEPQAA